MFLLNQNPFLRITIPFIAGIFLSAFNSLSFIPLIFALLCFIIAGIFTLFSGKYQTWSLRWVTGIMFLFFFMFLGMFYATNRTQINTPKNQLEITQDFSNLIVTVDDDVEVRPNSVKTILRIESKITDTSVAVVHGKMLSYFHRDTMSETLKYGDKLIINTKAAVPDGSMNPYAFNYRNYLEQQGVFYTAWIGQGKWQVLERNTGNKLKAYALELRQTILQILHKQLGDGSEYQVAAAIVAGYRTALDADLRQTFANAGAMHVMCVSGLHVGIIFLILSFLLKHMNDKKLMIRITKVIIILCVIWFYAMLTGLSASVLRSATMFSFVTLGMLLQRKVPVYNSLAASALFLLLLNPMYIYQVGFLLSYLAVIGIVALYPPISKLIPARGKIAIKIRDLVAVSVAAQIVTTPISLYYFNQFPNYFIITNILVVPLAGFIIYTAIPALILHSVPLIGDLLSFLLGLLMKAMNNSVMFVDSIPGAVSQNVYISFFQMLILYTVIILAFHGFRNMNKKLLVTALTLTIVFSGSGSLHSIMKMNHQEMIYPHGLNNTYIFTENNTMYVISNENTHELSKNLKRSLGKYITVNKINNIQYVSRDSAAYGNSFAFEFPLIQFADKKILLYDNSWYAKTEQPSLFPDYIFVENNPFLKYPQLTQQFGNATFIFSTANKKNTVRIWENLAKTEQIHYYNVFRDGAFVVK